MAGPGDSGHLDRSLGLLDVVLIGFNGVVGAGIFLLPAQVTPQLGAWSWVAYVICAFMCLLIGLCFAEMGSVHDETGGAFVYARDALGSFPGFLVGWIVWVAAVLGWASVATGFAEVLGKAPAMGPWQCFLQGPWGRAAVLVALVGTLGTFNLVGARLGARANHVFSVAKMVPLLLFVGVGMLSLASRTVPSQPAAPALGDWPTVLPTVVLYVLFAYSGFEEIPVPAGEVRDPQRVIPRALLLVLGSVTLLYLGVQVVSQLACPLLSPEDPNPLGTAAEAFMGPQGRKLLTLGALVSLLGTNASVAFTGPRSMYALASNGFLPALFARVHPRWHTPWTAIAATVTLTLGLPLLDIAVEAGRTTSLGAVLPRFDLATLVRMSALASVMQYIPTCLAVAVRRLQRRTEPAGFQIPGGITIPVLALGVCGWLVLACPLVDCLWTLGGMALGIPVYLFYRRAAVD